jgi:adenosylcobinamide-phosphate synthase
VTRRTTGAALGLLADRALPEPPRSAHPVALFGRTMSALEQGIYGDSRRSGMVYAATGTALAARVGALVRSTAVATGVSTSGSMLRSTAAGIGRQLEAGDLEAARADLPALVGRDPSVLDVSGIAAAAVESVAENTVDAVVAPVFWAVLAGGRGALAHRAVNTMDSMVGHRSGRYARFGWASARLDDAMAFVPARATALLVAIARPHAARAVMRTVARDAPAHPSPNAGVAEAAFAAALGVSLGGPIRYGDRFEARPRLGEGPRPSALDIARACRLADDVERALVGTLLVVGGATFLLARRSR